MSCARGPRSKGERQLLRDELPNWRAAVQRSCSGSIEPSVTVWLPAGGMRENGALLLPADGKAGRSAHWSTL